MYYKIRLYSQVGGNELSPIGWACADACRDGRRAEYAHVAPSDDVAVLFTSYEVARGFAESITQGSPLAYSVETYEARERYAPAIYKADGKGGREKAGYLSWRDDRDWPAVIWLSDINCPPSASFAEATRYYWISRNNAEYHGNAFAYFREYREAMLQGLYRCKILNDDAGGNLYSFVIEGVRIED